MAATSKESSRANSDTVLREVQAVHEEVKDLTKLLIGAPDEPDKPGLMERMRRVESRHRAELWVLMIAITLVISDIVARGITWYRGVP